MERSLPSGNLERRTCLADFQSILQCSWIKNRWSERVEINATRSVQHLERSQGRGQAQPNIQSIR